MSAAMSRYCPACGYTLAVCRRASAAEAEYMLCAHCFAPLQLPQGDAFFFTLVDLATLPAEDRLAFERTQYLVRTAWEGGAHA